MKQFPKKVIVKRVHLTSLKQGKELKHAFQVFSDGIFKVQLMYYRDSNISENIMRDILNYLHISKTEMMQLFANESINISVEFNNHIAYNIKPISTNGTIKWVFVGWFLRIDGLILMNMKDW